MRYAIITIVAVAVLGGAYVMTASPSDLPSRCRAYLNAGPPSQMRNYVPDSLTEIIISHGAESHPLDPELREIGTIILSEPRQHDPNEDEAIRNYMQNGRELVKEVLARQP